MSRKKNTLRKQRFERARKGCQQFGKPGIASNYLHHLPDLLAMNLPVFLYLRVSTPKQFNGRNIDDLREWSLRQLRRLFIKWPGGIYDCQESSHIQESRPILERIIADARDAGGIVVAPFRDRFIRHEFFDGTNSSDKPTDEEYRRLLEMADGVPLATIIHPDSPSRSIRTAQAMRARNANAGRPAKELSQRELLTAVSKLARELH